MTAHHNDNGLVARNSDYFVREITINQDYPIERLIEILHEMKTTGDLYIRFNQGGIGTVKLHERRAVNEDESDQIREILNIAERR